MKQKVFLISISLIIGLALGWLLFHSKGNSNVKAGQVIETTKSTIWTCAMHPQIRMIEPGKCPICGMDLIPLAQSGIFPPLVTEMIAVGEQSGTLENMLNRIATAYETEAQADIMVMTSLLEPAMIIVMALLVAFIVFSILLPIFEMNQLVK